MPVCSREQRAQQCRVGRAARGPGSSSLGVLLLLPWGLRRVLWLYKCGQHRIKSCSPRPNPILPSFPRLPWRRQRTGPGFLAALSGPHLARSVSRKSSHSPLVPAGHRVSVVADQHPQAWEATCDRKEVSVLVCAHSVLSPQARQWRKARALGPSFLQGVEASQVPFSGRLSGAWVPTPPLYQEGATVTREHDGEEKRSQSGVTSRT